MFGHILCLVLFVASVHVHANFDRYVGYLPQTSITDFAAIDLDQMNINEQLYDMNIEKALAVYTKGGHSGSYARLKLLELNGAASYPAGTQVLGLSQYEEIVEGFLQNDVTWDATATEFTVDVTYRVFDRQANFVSCQVGGLVDLQQANRDGCFADKNGATVKFVREGEKESDAVEYSYDYSVRKDNMNARSMQMLSRSAGERMKGYDGEYFEDFRHFVDYYGSSDYADKWILSVAKSTVTTFSKGNSDFSVISTIPARGEAMKKASAYMIIWMEVLHELNQAVKLCKTGGSKSSYTAVHHLDTAAAYYTGSLVTGSDTEDGILLHALAEVRAHQTKTAGHLGDKDTGDAYVNVQIFNHLKLMQGFISGGKPDQCAKAEESKNYISALMKIPLIQGVLRYAHIRQYAMPDLIDDHEKVLAEGAVFAATILPSVHACGSREANVVHEHMRVESPQSKFSFDAVRDALERQYACMGFSCQLVGGIWDGENWMNDGEPCGGAKKEGVSMGGIFGIVAGASLAAYIFIRYRGHFKKMMTGRQKKMPEMYSGNIAAVSEIS